MSVNRQALENQLFSAALPLTEHLTKIYMFPNVDYRQHWMKEVWNFVHQVPKLKNNNKFPEASFIFESLSGYADVSYNTIELIVGEYSEHAPERADGSELEEMLIQYFTWLADQLSEFGKVSSDEVYSKLEEIGF